MASRQIFDHPDLLEETPLLDLTEATKYLPIPCSRATLERWIRRGARGVRLETVLIGNRRFTTKQAIHRFLVSQQYTASEEVRTTAKRGMSKKDILVAARRFGLPEPLEASNVGINKEGRTQK